MKTWLKKARLVLCGFATGAGAILLVAATVIARRGLALATRGANGESPEGKGAEGNDERHETAAAEKREAEEAVMATPARAVAERYEGVGDAIAAGRNRFATRTKNRILSSGGSGADE